MTDQDTEFARWIINEGQAPSLRRRGLPTHTQYKTPGTQFLLSLVWRRLFWTHMRGGTSLLPPPRPCSLLWHHDHGGRPAAISASLTLHLSCNQHATLYNPGRCHSQETSQPANALPWFSCSSSPVCLRVHCITSVRKMEGWGEDGDLPSDNRTTYSKRLAWQNPCHVVKDANTQRKGCMKLNMKSWYTSCVNELVHPFGGHCAFSVFITASY